LSRRYQSEVTPNTQLYLKYYTYYYEQYLGQNLFWWFSVFWRRIQWFCTKGLSYFKKFGVKRILELWCGQGRDTILFASNGFDVHAIDGSKVAIENINQ